MMRHDQKEWVFEKETGRGQNDDKWNLEAVWRILREKVMQEERGKRVRYAYEWREPRI
jgi:nuclear transport factor 2 (NTF2) superfamily protein